MKELVGRRISVWEQRWRKWYRGTVIGYNNKLTKNLIQYDEETVDDKGIKIDRREDFYSFRLVKKEGAKRSVKWSLLGFN